jgi:hypothetical protein
VVDLVRELALARGPRLGEPLVGLPAQQLDVGLHQLVELEPVAVLAAVVVKAPAAVLEVLGSTRILEHAVDRDELGHHQLAHSVSLRFGPHTQDSARTTN